MNLVRPLFILLTLCCAPMAGWCGDEEYFDVSWDATQEQFKASFRHELLKEGPGYLLYKCTFMNESVYTSCSFHDDKLFSISLFLAGLENKIDAREALVVYKSGKQFLEGLFAKPTVNNLYFQYYSEQWMLNFNPDEVPENASYLLYSAWQELDKTIECRLNNDKKGASCIVAIYPPGVNMLNAE